MMLRRARRVDATSSVDSESIGINLTKYGFDEWLRMSLARCCSTASVSVAFAQRSYDHIICFCLRQVAQNQWNTKLLPAKLKCISRESNPGHIDGNDVFYH